MTISPPLEDEEISPTGLDLLTGAFVSLGNQFHHSHAWDKDSLCLYL